jgi:hypothetical protein
MTKKLNEQAIQNELEHSAFFQKAKTPVTESEHLSGSKPTQNNQETLSPSNHEAMEPRGHDTVTPRYHDLFLEDIRKALKSFGKEAATHRFTHTEKNEIAALIYQYKENGIRTSENEITRIAINFIINDQKEFGEDSILDIVLKLLNS